MMNAPQERGAKDQALRTRAKFMVETLVNVKNNKMRAIPGGEIAAEATQKMKKFLGGLTKKKHSRSDFAYLAGLD